MSDSEAFDFSVPVYQTMPANWQDAREFLVEQLRKIATQINVRENGYYFDIEQLSGASLYPDGGELRDVFRKVLPVGALNDFSATPTQTIPHGITTTSDTRLFRLFGSATDPGLTSAIPLPFVSAAGNHLELSIDGTNVYIKGSSDYSAYTSAFVVVEYVQQA